MTNTFYLGFDMTLLQQPNFIRLKRKLGHFGIGIYFELCLKLAISPDYKISLENIDDLAYDMHIEITDLESVIFDFDIFTKDKDFFWSESVLEKMLGLDQLRKKKSKAGKKSAEKRSTTSTGVEQVLNTTSTGVEQYNITQLNEIQLKVNKLKNNPTYEMQKQLAFPNLTDNQIESCLLSAVTSNLEISFSSALNWLKNANKDALKAGAKPETNLIDLPKIPTQAELANS